VKYRCNLDVLSSTTFCFLARSAFNGCPFFGGILTGCCSRACERRGLGSGRREAAMEEFLGLGLDYWRKGKGKVEAQARRKFLEMLSISCPKWMLGLQRGLRMGLWATARLILFDTTWLRVCLVPEPTGTEPLHSHFTYVWLTES
jgi:hypothetical protein